MDARERVARFNLSRIRRSASERNVWDPAQAEDAEADYRRFLYLKALYPRKRLVPWSGNMDYMWHEHILDTERYGKDCAKVVGHFIHHNPYLRQKPTIEALRRAQTRRLFAKAFVSTSYRPTSPRLRWAYVGDEGLKVFDAKARFVPEPE